ncbi:AraC family transcriptional regulator [Salmonella enterica]|uniref:AraC family transcriptional regulator n=1 Tax=Salmonella montevideo TaxID=115981 RepID=A0A730VLP6_SALMO|nr:AraC family transcriptional regulator [Salmonella enterica subsp. enterica serovar Duisburg]EAM2809853.1 AraC family transcriptional regulator [Salmonella enterica]EDM2051074.1 hypothetical protein [Salmonella enterica subsp. enterica serovar Muenchen]HAE4145906.1 AraC family transcriptional regulator [Salmonella enterica subsp. enterica serovar Montevideo]EAO3633819.1 AraC family transcriptional regulator [Salmonella enterica]
MLPFKNMIFNKYTLIYVTSSNVRIHLSGQDELELIKDTLFLIEKKSKVIGYSENISTSDVVCIDDEDIEKVIRFLPDKNIHNNVSPPIIIVPKLIEDEKKIFQLLKEDLSSFRRVSILLFILSRIEVEILTNFFRYSKPVSLISAKISSLIEEDLSSSWKIGDMAAALHTSVSSLRRRLKDEDYTFTQINLDTKMRNALRLIDCSCGNISKIASMLGYKSEAYFIAVFKRYYDITPKQFYLQRKRQRNSSRLLRSNLSVE